MGLGFVDLLTNGESKLLSVLNTGANDYVKIHNPFDPERESKRVLDRGYGIRFGRMGQVNGPSATTRFLTSRAILRVTLTNSLNTQDVDNQGLVTDLYADIETLIRAYYDGTCLDGAALQVRSYDATEPTIISGKEHVLVEIDFEVLFRELNNV